VAVTFVAATGTTTAIVTTATVTVPTGVQVGDLIILGHSIAASSASRTVTWPSGFTELGIVESSGHGDRVAWKIATASEVAGQSLTVTVSSGIKQALVLSSYRGTHQTTPVNQWAKSTAASGTTRIAPATAALTMSNCLKVQFVGDSTSTAGSNTTAWTPPGGLTSRNQEFTSGTGASSAAIADSSSTYYTAGSTPGNDTWTSDFSGLGGAWTLAISPPPSAPTAPQSVSATAGNGQATITWQAPASDGGSAITGYTVTGTPGGTATVSAGTTSTTISGLTNGVAYSFTVHATNNIGNSAESTPSNVVTPSLPLPTAPLNPQATAGDSQATITWQAPSSNGGSSITSYTVTTVPSGQTITTPNGSTLTATITGLANGSPYQFTVHATTAAGNGPESVLTNSVTPAGRVYVASEKVFYDNQWVPVANGYKQLQYEGTALTERNILNFAGSAVSMTDDPANNRTDITITAGGTSGGGSSGLPTWVINVKDYGAVGNGTTDDSDAIKAAFTAAIAGRGANGTSTPVVQKSLFFPPGTYRVTKADSLVFTPETGTSDLVLGLTIEGCGNRVSELFFDTTFTADSDPRKNNLITAGNRLRYTRFKNMSFRSTNGANNFAYFWSRDTDDTTYFYPLYGAGQNQYMFFENIEWRGTWNRVFGLDGDQQANLNSEWTFRSCVTDTVSTYTDAFMHVGITNPASYTQQDQMLNFWMYGCNWALAGGTMFLFDRGGSIDVHGGSWSMIGTGNTATYFKMNRGSDLTAARLLVEGVRFEPKGANHKIIDCNWEAGNVTFISCSDIAALQSGAYADYQLHNYTATTSNRIPIVRYVDCILAGYHNVTSSSTALTNGKMIYEGCRFYHWSVATGVSSAFLRASGSAFPAYAFRDSWNVADVSG